MRLFAGIDGGGTKTAYVVADETGHIVGQSVGATTAYDQCGQEGLVKNVEQGLREALGGRPIRALTGVCFGMPCLEENPREDEVARRNLAALFAGVEHYVCNDGEAGWAGSLKLRSGINVVAGTGTIAFGRDESGTVARSGGWSELIGDEGSGYWLGRLFFELFAKQADGRVKRGPLYDIARRELGLAYDFQAIDLAQEMSRERRKMASMQKLLMQAALEGDESALCAYDRAAGELAMLVEAVRGRLRFEGRVRVSYSGGVFGAKPLLDAFEKRMARADVQLCQPELEPRLGALLLAVERFGADCLNAFLSAL